MPGELGTYLALTGDVINSADIMKTRLGSKWRPTHDNLVDQFAEACRFFERPVSIEHYYGEQDTYAQALKKHEADLDKRWDIEADKLLRT